MRRLYLLLLIVGLSGGLLGCVSVHLRQARAGLDAAMAQLPEPDGFSVLTVVVEEFDRTWDQQKCYYAKALVAIGTDLSDEDAMQGYTEALAAQGWVAQPDHGTLISTEVLHRSEYERISVYTGAPGPIIESDERYRQVKDLYSTVVTLVYAYCLPSRAECW